MVLYLFLLLFAVTGLFWLMGMPAKQRVAVLSTAGPVLVIIVGSLLTLLRRGAIGIPLIFLGVSWWRRNRSKRPISSAEGQKSTVRSANLEMELDHDTGEMDGTVLTGQLQGVRLSSLSEEEILSLYFDFHSDTDSSPCLNPFSIDTTPIGAIGLILMILATGTGHRVLII